MFYITVGQEKEAYSDRFKIIKKRLNLEVDDKGVYICKGRLQGFYPIYLLQDSVLRWKKTRKSTIPSSPKPGSLLGDRTEKYFSLRLKTQTMQV